MDFRDYVNSRDIREYLYKIDYKLSGAQKLDIVENNHYLTVEQKLSLLEELLKEKDEKIQCECFSADGENKSFAEISLHEIVKREIATCRKKLELLTKEDSGCFYESALTLDRHDPFGKDKYELKMQDEKLAKEFDASDFYELDEFANVYSSPFHRYYANYQDCLNDYLEAVDRIYCEYIEHTFLSKADPESDDFDTDDELDDDFDDSVSYKDRLSSLIEKHGLTDDDLKKVKRACGIEGAIRKIYIFDKTDNTLQDKNNNFSGKNLYVSAYLNARGEVKDLLSNIDRMDSFDNQIIYSRTPVPVPFNEGDIVSYVHFYSDPSANDCIVKPASDPFILKEICEDDNDNTFNCDRIVSTGGKSYFVDTDDYHSYDIEYYRRPLDGKFIALKAIRNSLIDPDYYDETDANLLLEYFDQKEELDNLEVASRDEIESLNKKVNSLYRKMKSKRGLYGIINGIIKHGIILRRLSHEHCTYYQSIKIYLDDERQAPKGYEGCCSVKETIELINLCESSGTYIEELNLDSDLGEYSKEGGDAIKLLDYLVERRTFYKVVLHSSKTDDRANMQKESTDTGQKMSVSKLTA